MSIHENSNKPPGSQIRQGSGKTECQIKNNRALSIPSKSHSEQAFHCQSLCAPLELIPVKPAASQAFLWPLLLQSITDPTMLNVFHPLYSAIPLTLFYSENRGMEGLERFVYTI